MRQKLNQIQQPNNRTQVIEETGQSISHGLMKIDINNQLGCQYHEKCCVTNKTDCTSMRCTYRLDCTYCHPNEGSVDDINPVNRSIYLGCSGRSLHARLLDHLKDIRNGDTSNAMVKHFTNTHADQDWRNERPVRARKVKPHNHIMRRLIDEALRLEKNENLANSKGEWGRGGGLVRDHSTRTN